MKIISGLDFAKLIGCITTEICAQATVHFKLKNFSITIDDYRIIDNIIDYCANQSNWNKDNTIIIYTKTNFEFNCLCIGIDSIENLVNLIRRFENIKAFI